MKYVKNGLEVYETSYNNYAISVRPGFGKAKYQDMSKQDMIVELLEGGVLSLKQLRNMPKDLLSAVYYLHKHGKNEVLKKRFSIGIKY